MSAVTSTLDPVVYREGMLLKRQRGLKQGNAKRLKFQERFCRLTCTSLDYYDPNPKKRNEGPKGQFAVEQIKVAEAMEKELFGKEFPYSFQIGDNTEVMYFVSKTEKDKEEWLAACRHVARDAGNIFLTHHHHGVFGLVNKGRWSCCANPRRACPGCAPATLASDSDEIDAGLPNQLPVQLTPPTKRSPWSSPQSSPSPFHREKPPAASISHGVLSTVERVPLKDSDNSDDEMPPHPKILVRRFTLADLPGTPKKLKEQRKTCLNEKEGSMEEPTLAENSSDLFKERNIHNSLNSLSSIGSGGGKDEDRKKEEEDDSSKDSLIETTSNDSSSSHKEKEKEITNSRKTGPRGEIHLVALERTGASSPSPSVDSGCGVSRPNSQIDVVDLRVSRTESVGKKSVQAVVPDQAAMSNEGKKPSSKQTITEETDGPSKQVKQVSETGSEAGLDKSEEKYKDHGSRHSAQNKPKVPPKHINRKISSPPTPDIMITRRPVSPEDKGKPRPVSFCVSENESSESEMSRSITPRHKKLLASMASAGGSPKQERPRSWLLKGGPAVTLDGQHVQPCSRLHQACKDGNLLMLEEALDKVNLDEPSNAPIPYTPLFIAYINDHYQIMVSLLEHGANPNCEEPRKRSSLLQWASEKGCLDMVGLLIKYKADVNKKDSNGNTALMGACRNGHFEVVELLLKNGAHIDDDSKTQRTALHEATEGGHGDITELLLKQSEADPTMRDDNDNTPYDIAYLKKDEELILMLQLSLPKEVRPYSLLFTNTSATSQMITSLLIKDSESIVTGSRDCHVKFFSVADLAETYSMRLTDTVLDMSTSGGSQLILLGSTSIQLVDMEAPEKRKTVADDTQADENLLSPPLHVVQLGPKGQMATASVESNVVKLWPPVSRNTGHITYAENTLHVGEDRNSVGCVYSLSISPDPNSPWLVVGLQPGSMLHPDGFKLVYCYDMAKRKLHHIFDAGDGGFGVGVCTKFSPDGKKLAIGCSEHLCIWEIKTGNLLQKFTTSSSVSILCLSFSPNGSQLAAGLQSGEVQVFEILSSSPVFSLPPANNAVPVTAITYSSCGKMFASGYLDGTLRLWEAYGGTVL